VTSRERIFGPPGYIKVNRYALRLEKRSTTSLELMLFDAASEVNFMPEKLVYAAEPPMLPEYTPWLKWFGWICYPRIYRETYDVYEVDQAKTQVRWRLVWRFPVREYVGRMQYRAMQDEVRSCMVTSIRADAFEILMGPVPLEMFNPTAFGGGFADVPEVKAHRRIQIETSIIHSPLHFTMIGRCSPGLEK
jgi:hypothetical protein